MQATLAVQSKGFIARQPKQSTTKEHGIKIREKRLGLEAMRLDKRKKVPLAFMTPEAVASPINIVSEESMYLKKPSLISVFEGGAAPS